MRPAPNLCGDCPLSGCSSSSTFPSTPAPSQPALAACQLHSHGTQSGRAAGRSSAITPTALSSPAAASPISLMPPSVGETVDVRERSSPASAAGRSWLCGRCCCRGRSFGNVTPFSRCAAERPIVGPRVVSWAAQQTEASAPMVAGSARVHWASSSSRCCCWQSRPSGRSGNRALRVHCRSRSRRPPDSRPSAPAAHLCCCMWEHTVPVPVPASAAIHEFTFRWPHQFDGAEAEHKGEGLCKRLRAAPAHAPSALATRTASGQEEREGREERGAWAGAGAGRTKGVR